jgi:hypothetical protein
VGGIGVTVSVGVGGMVGGGEVSVGVFVGGMSVWVGVKVGVLVGMSVGGGRVGEIVAVEVGKGMGVRVATFGTNRVCPVIMREPEIQLACCKAKTVV